jgi:hypothetical protein
MRVSDATCTCVLSMHACDPAHPLRARGTRVACHLPTHRRDTHR